MSTADPPTDFIRDIVAEDIHAGLHPAPVTRFPPEPNGYLHIGHAKAICLNFGIAAEYEGGRCNLRFDDTNPSKEEAAFAEAIKEDIQWLGFDWGENLFYASDYFDQLYLWAEGLIEAGKAYVDEQSAEEIRKNRGGLREPGVDSPFRSRPIEESLAEFRKMKAGDYPNGAKVLRAKIDMAATNLNLRDPVLYRILHENHPRTGDQWCIYPMYDYTHGQSDALEGITHSLCSLEFENHRPLYDWFLDNLPVPSRPKQREFNRLNLTYTVMSKRKLTRLVEEGKVSGWDDPRLPTLSGMRRRGFPPGALREFCRRVGVSKTNSTVEYALLEHCVRDELNATAPRTMAVLDPLKVVITTLPEDHFEEFEADVIPGNESAGKRTIPFSREVWIERADFMDEPPRKFFRLGPGREVKLRYGYCITCEEVIHDDQGRVVELRCSHDPETRHGLPKDRKVKGFLHWVSVKDAEQADVHMLGQLFHSENPEADGDFLADLVTESCEEKKGVQLEQGTLAAGQGAILQFERNGYFRLDRMGQEGNPAVFLQTVGLRDKWAKIMAKEKNA